MPVIAGFDKLASVPEEQITDKIRRRIVSGKQGTMVYWTVKAGARAAATFISAFSIRKRPGFLSFVEAADIPPALVRERG